MESFSEEVIFEQNGMERESEPCKDLETRIHFRYRKPTGWSRSLRWKQT